MDTELLTACDRYVMLPVPDRNTVREALISMELGSLTEQQRAVAQAMLDSYGFCNARYCSELWLNW